MQHSQEKFSHFIVQVFIWLYLGLETNRAQILKYSYLNSFTSLDPDPNSFFFHTNLNLKLLET